jgi:leishmanolysin-like peptidase
MAHALGFTRGSLALFRDADAGGAPRTPRVNGGFAGEPDVVALNNTYGVSESTVQWSSERGHDQCDPVKNPAACVFHLVTPAVRQAARNHFGCDTLPGAELENQPTVGGTKSSLSQ